jgi:hypothetical protein
MAVTLYKDRVEIAIPARFMFAVACLDVFAIEDGDDDAPRRLAKMRALLEDACIAPLDGISPAAKKQAGFVIDRLCKQTLGSYDQEPAAKVAAAVFYFVKEITDSEYLALYEGSPVAEAAAIFIPTIEHVFGESKLDASAQKAARRMLSKLQERGYFI